MRACVCVCVCVFILQKPDTQWRQQQNDPMQKIHTQWRQNQEHNAKGSSNAKHTHTYSHMEGNSSITQCKKVEATEKGPNAKNTHSGSQNPIQKTHTHRRQQQKDPMQKLTNTVETTSRIQSKNLTHSGGNFKNSMQKPHTQWRQLQGLNVKTTHTVETTSRTQCRNHTHSVGNFMDSMQKPHTQWR